VTAELLNAWLATVPPGADRALACAAGEDLIARWSEPQRHYHTLEHLTFMLSVVDAAAIRGVASDPAAASADLTAVRLAAWFHDAVYDPTGTDNEERSASLATRVLPTLRVGEGTVAEVARLVLLTADHRVAAGDPSGAPLADADLAILGTARETYRAYADAIRREYAHVPDNVFRSGRATVIDRFLSRPRIFFTEQMFGRSESAARANMLRERERLTRSHLSDSRHI